MTDAEIEEYLRDNGYPEHICRGGRQGLVARWLRFVEEVERGYRYGLEDYRNDLDLRGVLAMLGLDREGPEAGLLRQADERLRPMLAATDRRVWESAAGNPFWDFGFPANAGGDLLRDLRAEGLAT